MAFVLACSGPDETPPDSGTPTEAEDAVPPGASGEATLFDGRRPLPPGAHAELLEQFREAEAKPVSESDGQGSATLSPADPVRAGSLGSWTIRFAAGPSGVAAGG
ncbi:MAG TPA: hypothetical protein VLL75_06125, partial [Vicinamibacteria bacterium]|nr:hypothetical protein [Vicinamibacteria bacterium]